MREKHRPVDETLHPTPPCGSVGIAQGVPMYSMIFSGSPAEADEVRAILRAAVKEREHRHRFFAKSSFACPFIASSTSLMQKTSVSAGACLGANEHQDFSNQTCNAASRIAVHHVFNLRGNDETR